MMDLTPHQILAAARLAVFKRAPFFRAGILGLVPREVPGYGTFGTTKDWILLWDPEVVAEYGVEGTAAVLVHELSHLVRDHFGRFSAPLVNKDLANIAGDLSINPGVARMGFTFPEGRHAGLWPKDFKLPDDLTAEQYYQKLEKMDVKYVYYDAADGQNSHGAQIKIEGCGSCSGRALPGEPSGDAEGRSEAEVGRIKITIAKAVQSAGRGTVPADLERWAGETLKPPKVRWQDKLCRVCRAAIAYRPGGGSATYARPSRRQAGLGFGPGCPVLPSYRATIPRVTFLIDTSGSMGTETLRAAMSEAQGVLAAAGAQMRVVACDAEVHASKEVKGIAEACKLLRGGGGSDFRPAFDEIAARRPKTDVVVAATDGDITVPLEAPAGVQVIWLLFKGQWSNGEFHRPCGWGTFVEVEE